NGCEQCKQKASHAELPPLSLDGASVVSVFQSRFVKNKSTPARFRNEKGWMVMRVRREVRTHVPPDSNGRLEVDGRAVAQSDPHGGLPSPAQVFGRFVSRHTVRPYPVGWLAG